MCPRLFDVGRIMCEVDGWLHWANHFSLFTTVSRGRVQKTNGFSPSAAPVQEKHGRPDFWTHGMRKARYLKERGGWWWWLMKAVITSQIDISQLTSTNSARCATRGASSRRRVGCPQCTLTRRPTSSLCASAAVHRRWKSGKRKAGVGHWHQLLSKQTSDPFLFNIVAREAKPPPLPEVATGPTRGHKAGKQTCSLGVSMSLAHSSAHAWLCTCKLCWNPSNVPQQGSILCILVYTASLMLLRCRCQWKSIMAYV